MAKPAPADGITFVETHWPTDGSAYSDAHITAALEMAAELIRYTNHATMEIQLDTVQDLDEILVPLGRLADRLPQLLSQLSGNATRFAADENLRHDAHGDDAAAASDTATAAAGLLLDASRACDTVSTVVGYVRSNTSHLKYRVD